MDITYCVCKEDEPTMKVDINLFITSIIAIEIVVSFCYDIFMWLKMMKNHTRPINQYLIVITIRYIAGQTAIPLK